jgi:hypothetical protein
LVSETIGQWTIRQRQFVSEANEKTVKFLVGYEVKCIFGQEWIESVFSIIVELVKLTEKLVTIDRKSQNGVFSWFLMVKIVTLMFRVLTSTYNGFSIFLLSSSGSTIMLKTLSIHSWPTWLR